jgi:hypothetical protein
MMLLEKKKEEHSMKGSNYQSITHDDSERPVLVESDQQVKVQVRRYLFGSLLAVCALFIFVESPYKYTQMEKTITTHQAPLLGISYDTANDFKKQVDDNPEGLLRTAHEFLAEAILADRSDQELLNTLEYLEKPKEGDALEVESQNLIEPPCEIEMIANTIGFIFSVLGLPGRSTSKIGQAVFRKLPQSLRTKIVRQVRSMVSRPHDIVFVKSAMKEIFQAIFEGISINAFSDILYKEMGALDWFIVILSITGNIVAAAVTGCTAVAIKICFIMIDLAGLLIGADNCFNVTPGPGPSPTPTCLPSFGPCGKELRAEVSKYQWNCDRCCSGRYKATYSNNIFFFYECSITPPRCLTRGEICGGHDCRHHFCDCSLCCSGQSESYGWNDECQ